MIKKKYPKWFRRRGYIHFDRPVGFSTARRLVTDPNRVARHSFYPLIDFAVTSFKVKRNPESKKLERREKSRPIAYASHLDSHIYSYYAYLLANRYEQSICADGLSSSILAFRALGKSNIHFAADAFAEIRKRNECHVLCLDIEGFFDNLDHAVLKKAWANLLKAEALPDDHYAIFRSLTRYSTVKLEELYALLGISVHNPKNGRRRLCEPEEFRDKVRKAGLIKVNNMTHGIPQGSPISALLSNIYMHSFDCFVVEYVNQHGGCYFRYCDDILLIMPMAVRDEVLSVIQNEISKLKLTIQAKKTEQRDFALQDGRLVTHKPLQYLGFLFDGQRVFLRSASLARYSERMAKGVRMAKATMAKRNLARVERGESMKPLFKKQLYKRYSFAGRRNFITYGYNAAKIIQSNSIKRQMQKLWKKLQSEIGTDLPQIKDRDMQVRKKK